LFEEELFTDLHTYRCRLRAFTNFFEISSWSQTYISFFLRTSIALKDPHLVSSTPIYSLRHSRHARFHGCHNATFGTSFEKI